MADCPAPIWKSSPEDVVLHAQGPLTSWQGMTVTLLPVWDARNGIFAHLTYADALKVAERFGARLGSTTEFDTIHKLGFEIAPCIAGFDADDIACAQQLGYDLTDKDQKATFYSLRMGTKLWAARHTACVLRKLSGWDGTKPVSNAGKNWIIGAAPGMALNYGWYDPEAPNGRMWQSLGTKHNAQHHDYSQLTMLFQGPIPAGTPIAGGGGGGGSGPIVKPPIQVGPELATELGAVALSAAVGTGIGYHVGARTGGAWGCMLGTAAGLFIGKMLNGTAGPA